MGSPSPDVCADGGLPGIVFEFDRPPNAFIFDVITDNPGKVGFDAEILG